MAHAGDIPQLHGGKLPPVDIVTFGSPCQGLSMAGQRRGLADERSGLFMEAIRIIDEMREATHGEYPRFALFENVHGALSSAGGRDFAAVLQSFTKAEIPMPILDGGQTPEWYEAEALISLGACTTPNISAQHSGAGACFLSAILQENVPEKYSLSPKACAGILRRAGRPGKDLSPFVKTAPLQHGGG